MKKALTILLAVMMIVSIAAVAPFSASAAGTLAVGQVAEDYVPEGEAIYDAYDFEHMAPNGVYYLAADITVSETYADLFTGTLDGNGKTITTSVPLFAMFGGTVKNVTLEGAVSLAFGDTTGYAAVVACQVPAQKVTFVNICNNATLTADGNKSGSSTGALVGYGSGDCDILVEDCENNANITGPGQTGAFIGYVQGKTLTIKNCVNNGDEIKSTANYAGGIISRFGKNDSTKDFRCNIYDCVNNATVQSYKDQAGGIVGYAVGVYDIQRCVNNGDIFGALYGDKLNVSGSAGGIVGSGSKYDNGFVVKQCVNFGVITARSQGKDKKNLGKAAYAGGIAGKSGTDKGAVTTFQYIGCVNFGKVVRTGNAYATNSSVDGASGIIGYLYGGSTNNGVFYCVNFGEVELNNTIKRKDGTLNVAAGLIAYFNGTKTFVTNNINVGSISVTGNNNNNATYCVELFYNKSADGVTSEYAYGNFAWEGTTNAIAVNGAADPCYTLIKDHDELEAMAEVQVDWIANTMDKDYEVIIPGGAFEYDDTPATGDAMVYVAIALAVSVLSVVALVVVKKKENN